MVHWLILNALKSMKEENDKLKALHSQFKVNIGTWKKFWMPWKKLSFIAKESKFLKNKPTAKF